MKLKNVGTIDAYIRICIGTMALIWVVAGRAGRMRGALTLFGAMKVAEGVTRFSPFLAALGVSTLEDVTAEPGRGEEDEYRLRRPLPSPLS